MSGTRRSVCGVWVAVAAILCVTTVLLSPSASAWLIQHLALEPDA